MIFRTVIGALSPLLRAMLGDLGHLDLVTIHLCDFAKPSLESLVHRMRGQGDEQLSPEEMELMDALGVAFDPNGSPNASLVPESPSTVGTNISTGASEESTDTKMEEDKQSETSDFKASLKAALASTCKDSDNTENLRQGKKQKDIKFKDKPKVVRYKEKKSQQQPAQTLIGNERNPNESRTSKSANKNAPQLSNVKENLENHHNHPSPALLQAQCPRCTQRFSGVRSKVTTSLTNHLGNMHFHTQLLAQISTNFIDNTCNLCQEVIKLGTSGKKKHLLFTHKLFMEEVQALLAAALKQPEEHKSESEKLQKDASVPDVKSSSKDNQIEPQPALKMPKKLILASTLKRREKPTTDSAKNQPTPCATDLQLPVKENKLEPEPDLKIQKREVPTSALKKPEEPELALQSTKGASDVHSPVKENDGEPGSALKILKKHNPTGKTFSCTLCPKVWNIAVNIRASLNGHVLPHFHDQFKNKIEKLYTGHNCTLCGELIMTNSKKRNHLYHKHDILKVKIQNTFKAILRGPQGRKNSELVLDDSENSPNLKPKSSQSIKGTKVVEYKAPAYAGITEDGDLESERKVQAMLMMHQDISDSDDEI